jgi:hypothetical protein
MDIYIRNSLLEQYKIYPTFEDNLLNFSSNLKYDTMTFVQKILIDTKYDVA